MKDSGNTDPQLNRLRRAIGSWPIPVHDPDLPAAAVAVLLRQGHRGSELLLVKRAERAGDVWSGHVALPGGKIDPHDHSLVHTVRRETMEEVSIDLENAELIGILEPVMPRSPYAPRIAVYPFVWVVPKDTEPDPNEEIDSTRWFTLEWLRCGAAATTLELEVPGTGAQVTLPGITVGDDVLWGITHRVVMMLLDAIGSQQ